MRVLTVGALVVVLAGLAAVWVVRTEPDLYLRARYPLRYEAIIRTHAENYVLVNATPTAEIYPD